MQPLLNLEVHLDGTGTVSGLDADADLVPILTLTADQVREFREFGMDDRLPNPHLDN